MQVARQQWVAGWAWPAPRQDKHELSLPDDADVCGGVAVSPHMHVDCRALASILCRQSPPRAIIIGVITDGREVCAQAIGSTVGSVDWGVLWCSEWFVRCEGWELRGPRSGGGENVRP